MACAGGSNTVLLAHLTGKRYEWKHLEAICLNDKKIQLVDVVKGLEEILGKFFFSKKKVKVSLCRVSR